MTATIAASLISEEPPHRQSIRVGHHMIVADEPVANGGGDAGASPFGLMLGALAACTSITLRMYADRKGWSLGVVNVDVSLSRDGDVQRIERVIRFGAPLSDEQKQRLAEIADKTPVTKVVRAGMPIATTV
jgi:putative redox protein